MCVQEKLSQSVEIKTNPTTRQSSNFVQNSHTPARTMDPISWSWALTTQFNAREEKLCAYPASIPS